MLPRVARNSTRSNDCSRARLTTPVTYPNRPCDSNPNLPPRLAPPSSRRSIAPPAAAGARSVRTVYDGSEIAASEKMSPHFCAGETARDGADASGVRRLGVRAFAHQTEAEGGGGGAEDAAMGGGRGMLRPRGETTRLGRRRGATLRAPRARLLHMRQLDEVVVVGDELRLALLQLLQVLGSLLEHTLQL